MTCRYCQLDEWRSRGCMISSIEIEGISRPRIPYTPPYYGERFERCHDCGATDKHYHHPQCDMEPCPNCMGQLIACGCEITGVLQGIQLSQELLTKVYERAKEEQQKREHKNES